VFFSGAMPDVDRGGAGWGQTGRVLALLAILLRVEATGPSFQPGRLQMRGGMPAAANGGVSGKSAWRYWRNGVGNEKNEEDRLRSVLTEAEAEVASLCDDLLDARAAQGRANTALQAKDQMIASSELALSDLRANSELASDTSESHSAQLHELQEKLAALVPPPPALEATQGQILSQSPPVRGSICMGVD